MMLALALLAAICAPSIGLAAADACILPSLAFAPPALSTHLRQNPSFGQKRPQAAAAEKSALQRPATLGQLRRADVVKLRAQKLPRGLQERIVNIHGEEFKVALSPTRVGSTEVRSALVPRSCIHSNFPVDVPR